MKVYGRAKRTVDDTGLMEMSEVCICAHPDALRAMAKLLEECALELEGDQRYKFSHKHLSGVWNNFGQKMTDLIVSNPRKS